MTFQTGNIQPLSYQGVRSPFPPNVSVQSRAPLTSDRQNFVLGDLWLDKVTQDVYILVSLESGIAIWKYITSDSVISTWTPELNFGGAHVGMTFNSREGFYYRMGLLVYIYFRIDLSNKGTSMGVATIDQLPFTTLTTIGGVPMTVLFPRDLIFSGIPGGQLITNSTQLALREYVTSATYNVIDNSYFANDTVIACSGSYLIEV